MLNDIVMKDTPLIGQSISDLESFVSSLDEKAFRGRQLFDWIYRQKVYDISLMTDLSKSFRKKLAGVKIHPLEIVKSNLSPSKNTQKFLFKISSGELVESVLMEEDGRVTVCLSTQVGCAVDCDFCATAKMGFIKNLTVGEIIDQFLILQSTSNIKITNVVFMGMGEPFLNYDNTIAAADLLHHPKGINMGAWRITISTAGIISKIKKYTEEKHPYKLAVSLNATSESQRFEIMPITKSHSFEDLLKVSKDYAYHSRKRITFEYVLLKDINDEPSDAFRLKEMLSKTHCKLNIIPYNEIGGKFQRPSDKKIQKFLEPLKDTLFPVTVRWSKGTDIAAGCGQLATEVV
tara:strand:+ start:7965 stop:9005 length:1041 start_codon:yes stop_codon:yes gene_type:complete